MKFKDYKILLIKTLVVCLAFIIVPYAIPYVVEFVLMLDIAALEALLVFLFLLSKPARVAMLVKLNTWTTHLAMVLVLITGMYMFQTDVFLMHSLGSLVLLLGACSLLAALAIWVPPIVLSYVDGKARYRTIPLISPTTGTPPSP